jgi:hypothetical protein
MSTAINVDKKIAGRPHGEVRTCINSSTVTTHTDTRVVLAMRRLSYRVHASGRATVTTHAVLRATATHAVVGASVSGSNTPGSYIIRGAPIQNTHKTATGTSVTALSQPHPGICSCDVRGACPGTAVRCGEASSGSTTRPCSTACFRLRCCLCLCRQHQTHASKATGQPIAHNAVSVSNEHDPGKVYRMLIHCHDLTMPQYLCRGVHGTWTG